MFPSLVSLIPLALATSPDGAPAFDEARAIAHYESFVYELFQADWGDADKRLPVTAKRERPEVAVGLWPVDPAHGLYCNSEEKLRAFKWVGAGLTERPKGPTEHDIPSVCALTDLNFGYYNGFKQDTRPDLCVDGTNATGAWQGAAACYFSTHGEYGSPGFWLALRELEGRVVVAGVLAHKAALEEPEKDRGLKPFLTAIEKKLAPKPAPKGKGKH